MRFVNNRTGTSRLKNNESYIKGLKTDVSYISAGIPKQESEDTKTRKEIHISIDKMAKENKTSIEIKYSLTDKYPSYEEYIVKMINQYFGKLNSTNIKTKASREEGDER